MWTPERQKSEMATNQPSGFVNRASTIWTTFRLSPLREEFVGCVLRLFVTKLLHLLVDPPLVAEGIDDLPVASSPEHVLHGHAHARAGGHRALHNRVRIVHQESDAYARSPERLRRLAGSAFARGELVADEELMSVQSQFAVEELLAARLDHSVHLLRAKDALVEVERVEPAAYDQFGDELVRSMHSLLRFHAFFRSYYAFAPASCELSTATRPKKALFVEVPRRFEPASA